MYDSVTYNTPINELVIQPYQHYKVNDSLITYNWTSRTAQ